VLNFTTRTEKVGFETDEQLELYKYIFEIIFYWCSLFTMFNFISVLTLSVYWHAEIFFSDKIFKLLVIAKNFGFA